MLNKKRNNKGFTLVELLVVIAIIGILAVVAVPALFKNIEKGKVADLEADISAIRSASLSHYADESKYPTIMSDIEDEIESLGNPFGEGIYTLSGTAPNDLELLIKTKTNISDSGLAKLENDLGEDKYHLASNCPNTTEVIRETSQEIHVRILEGEQPEGEQSRS